MLFLLYRIIVDLLRLANKLELFQGLTRKLKPNSKICRNCIRQFHYNNSSYRPIFWYAFASDFRLMINIRPMTSAYVKSIHTKIIRSDFTPNILQLVSLINSASDPTVCLRWWWSNCWLLDGKLKLFHIVSMSRRRIF